MDRAKMIAWFKNRAENTPMAGARAMYQATYELLTQSQWISVKERLPEKDKYVWCFSNKNGGYMFKGYRGWFTGEWMEGGSMHIAEVTHWMPLPEPPKGE